MSDKRQRIRLNIISEAETSQLLSEKPEMRGCIALALVTGGSGFAASNLAVYARKAIPR